MAIARITHISGAITLLITIFSLSLPAYAQYSGGTGEPNDPYQIATAEDLMLLGENPNDYDKHFILTADIDLDPNLPGRKVFDRAVIAPDVNDDEDWFQGSRFTGVFDGNDHVISHLTITGGGDLGLFGQTGRGARISNLGLGAVDVSGTGESVGGLVGRKYGSSITTSYSTGMVSGDSYVGGLVGYNSGSITSSYSTGTVNGGGGVGGLVGRNYGSITTSYSAGTVTGRSSVGGLVGSNYEGSITTSYSTGTVSGDRYVGGLVGSGNPTRVYNSLWDMETSGLTVSTGGVGLTMAEMMDPYMLGLNGFANDPNWVLDAGRDYPRLAWEGMAGHIIPEPIVEWLDGKGTDQEPYLINMANQLILMRQASGLWDKHFILGADIDLDPNLPGRQVFSQAVIQVFSGVFDGNGHMISHLKIRGGSCLGLFGQLEAGAIISNLGLKAVDVSGDETVGSLAGGNGGSIITSYSTGSVSGDDHVGGLVGRNNEGIITSSYSIGSVTGGRSSRYVGGLVGSNHEGSITTSYSTGTVSGDRYVGGLVGNGYPTGVYNSVWDMESSALSGSSGGVGLTTTEMMDRYMLGLNGFANDPNWVLDVGHDYPRLAWEGTAGQIIPEPIIDWLDGKGTDQEPYRVDMADQLIILSRAGVLWDKHFILSANIDLDPNLPGRQVFSRAVIQSFEGVFDGKDHTISHLTIRGGSYLGLFGQTGSGARISNLGLEAVDVSGTGECVGGLVGHNSGNITASYSTGSVGGDSNVGGLVGYNKEGSIMSSHSADSVSGDSGVGGLVGYNKEGSIMSSYSTGSVTGDHSVGGLVGSQGWLWGSPVDADAIVANCYSSGIINGNSSVGGLAGSNGGSITSSYSTGMVTGNEHIGGLVGYNYYDYDRIATSFWDMETAGQTTSDGGTGATTAEMQAASTYLEAGWDFVDEIENGTENIWWIDEGNDYPRLWWEATEQ